MESLTPEGVSYIGARYTGAGHSFRAVRHNKQMA
jgi:hypothetical protein